MVARSNKIKISAKSAALTAEKRKEIARYMAFSGHNEYSYVGEYCARNTGMKKDAEACARYYFDNKWMTGIPFKSNSYRNDKCCFLPIYQCMIIAYTTIDEAERFGEATQQIYGHVHYYYYYDPTFVNVTKALNVYCRAFPEVLKAFTDTDDFATCVPSEQEQLIAMERWSSVKNSMDELNLTSDAITLLLSIIRLPEFRPFFLTLPENALVGLMNKLLDRYLSLQFLSDEDYDYYVDMMTPSKEHNVSEYLGDMRDYFVLFQHFLRHGDIDGHLQQMHNGSCAQKTLQAIKYLQEGRPNEAVKEMESFLKAFKMTIFEMPLCDFVYGIALLQSDTPASHKKAEALQKKKIVKDNPKIPYLRLLLIKKTNPETDFSAWIMKNLNCTYTTHIGAALFSMLCVHYGCCNEYKATAMNYCKAFVRDNIRVLALDLCRDLDAYKPFAERFIQETKMQPLLPEVKKLEHWEIIIDSMMQRFDTAASSKTGKTKTQQDVRRVSYLISGSRYSVQPRLQKSKNGGVTWSSGRNIALKNFQKGIPEMAPIDSRVALLVETYNYGWYGGTALDLSGPKVIEALIGHPYVFDENNPDLKIEIQSERLQIQVKESSSGYAVSANVEQKDGSYETINIHRENAQLLKVIRLTTEEKDILSLLNRVGTFPKKSKDKLTQLLSVLGKKVTVMSSLLKNADNVKQKKGDSKLTIQLVPYGDQFTVRSFVKPLTSCPPYCTPGKGLEFIAANVKGEMVQVVRNLAAERKNAKAFAEWMEPFDDYAEEEGWMLPIESCLEVLDLLRQHSKTCNIEWPEGVKFKVVRPSLMPDNISVSVKGMGHWFEVDGEVKIDEKQQMKVSDLLKRVREAKGRFIQIGDDEYIALSQQLQKQLSALDRIMQTDRKSLKIASYNSSFLQDLADAGATVKADKKYTEMLKRMDEADTMKISVPKTLQADLRDYQKDGYRWLCRLAHWGAGACLADDMGLGKTIQTLALLLSRAKEGASLVIMPTSVLINWRNEMNRFAPSLNPVILRDANDRAEAINNAGAQDVILATYGLLPTEEETLTKKKWNVIVLDEAHTIKNKETKTSKAAMQLEGQFRLLLTGTPLQNHLSEIWNLFQFATPGLLADYTQFTEEFINPIEKSHDKEPQRLLKRMLQPFILRRTKSEVLSELPEKTEITLKVELSDAERALYDRFREEAMLNLEDGGNETAIKALAELTRLRQAACNAALVLPADEAKAIPSSKMEAFMKLVDELMRNHHRALVFSQFTSHLSLVEKELKKLNIEYEYLDGSVTPAERLKRVANFQNGDMPLFLISLKAGGTGLNLTAADYVIHLDPWWNPAIEDQASDRAYRIGQDKPVTVYRLIAENTVEEKIIALHQSKKSLADALLEGSDMAYALGKDEILNLIRGGSL